MKLAVLIAVHRQLDLNQLHLDQKVEVGQWFRSAAEPCWLPANEVATDLAALRGRHVRLVDLIERMISISSNDATNLLMELVGRGPLTGVLSDLGATGNCILRLISDGPARALGPANLVTSIDLCRLLTGIASGRAASAWSCGQMPAVLGRQQYRDEISAGVPRELRTTNKSGWDPGLRYDAALGWAQTPRVLPCRLHHWVQLGRGRPGRDPRAIQMVLRAEAFAQGSEPARPPPLCALPPLIRRETGPGRKAPPSTGVRSGRQGGGIHLEPCHSLHVADEQRLRRRHVVPRQRHMEHSPGLRTATSSSTGLQLGATAAAAQLLVPQALVAPAPRSQTVSRSSPLAGSTVTGSTFTAPACERSSWGPRTEMSTSRTASPAMTRLGVAHGSQTGPGAGQRRREPGSNLTVPISAVSCSAAAAVPESAALTRRNPAAVSTVRVGLATSPQSRTARTTQRTPLPVISASMPSALTSSIRTSPPAHGESTLMTPSAPWCRSHRRRAREGLGPLLASQSNTTKKSSPVASSLATVSSVIG